MSGAMTNKVFQIEWPSEKADNHRKVLVRIFGEGVTKKSALLSACLSMVMVHDFLEDSQRDVLRNSFMLGDPEISARIAANIWEFHNLEMSGSKEIVLWNRMRNWIKKAKNMCSEKEFGLTSLEDEIQMLKNELPEDGSVVGFRHNDMQYGNIMMDEEKGSITLIISHHLSIDTDYEYASYNPIAYDLANHFCEMATDYHYEISHVLDYDKYPDLEECQRFADAYLSSLGEEPSESEVDALVESAEKYSLANHLLWGLRGLISPYVNMIEFDYKEYLRFHWCHIRKPVPLNASAMKPSKPIAMAASALAPLTNLCIKGTRPCN
ncbi:hypothetical protein V2J09_008422 [Rumex salicifolius]